MPKRNTVVEPRGSKEEKAVFTSVYRHYTTSRDDNDQRQTRRNGWDDADKMFASYIDPDTWPYRSMIFDPRPFTAIIEKSARLIGSKPRGRLVPREGGDELGARINNELLSFQWDDNDRLGETMISKWIKMDQSTRKYGASYAICKWRYETRLSKGKRKPFYDGPDMVVIPRRDALPNPSYSTIQNWFQHREWLTLNDLQNVNDVAKTNPTYKNLDILKQALKDEYDATGKGDKRDTTYVTKNKSMRGLQDYLGEDEVYKTIEVITEYRNDRWITIAPRYGVVLRDIDNPYDHGQIPVVQLKYYPLQDDIDGVSEFEPVASQIKAINAYMSAYSDTLALSLRPPVMVNPKAVHMHTLEFSPEAKWLMDNPNIDAQLMKIDTSATNNFQAGYTTMVSSLLNAWGEASQGTSSIDPFSNEKTATEVRDTAFTRNVRDNMNLIFLTDAIKRQTMLWHSMNQQFLLSGTTDQYKVLRIVGRDAVEYFQRQGLSDISPTDTESQQIAMGELSAESILPGPRFPVEDNEGNIVPKMSLDPSGNSAELLIEQGDLNGTYDYIADVESMQPPSAQDVEKKLTAILATITNPQIIQLLAQEGQKPKVVELLTKMFESTNVIKDADAYFEEIKQPTLDVQNQGSVIPGGAGIAPTGSLPQGANPNQGLAGNPQATAGGLNQPFMG